MMPFRLTSTPQGTLVGEVRRHPANAGVAVVVHGIGAFRQEPLVQSMAQAAYDSGMSVVTYDARHGFGESDGALHDLRFGTFYDDLSAVMAWLNTQPWYEGKVTLLGHSLGGAVCLQYAAQHPQEVLKLVLVSCVVGGPWWLKAHQEAIPETLKAWQDTGELPKTHPLDPQKTGSIAWAYAADIMQRDLIKQAAPRVVCPSLQLVGSIDPITPLAAQQDLFNALPGPKKLGVMAGCGHTYKSAQQRQALAESITAWLNGADD